MKSIVLMLLGLAVGYCFGLMESRNHRDLQRQPSASAEVSAPLESDDKCAKESAAAFHSMGYTWSPPYFSYQNHYNKQLGRCMILIAENADKITEFYDLFDANEHKKYAEYFGSTQGTPLTCYVLSPTGEVGLCHWYDDFAKLVKPYMSN